MDIATRANTAIADEPICQMIPRSVEPLGARFLPTKNQSTAST